MKSLYLVLYIVAAILFLVAVFVPSPAVATGGKVRGFHLVAAGLFVWVLVDVIRQWDFVVD
jgi:hypothetical protein